MPLVFEITGTNMDKSRLPIDVMTRVVAEQLYSTPGRCKMFIVSIVATYKNAI